MLNRQESYQFQVVVANHANCQAATGICEVKEQRIKQKHRKGSDDGKDRVPQLT
ncbi:MAG: hypothetical protein JWL90_3978 [Chthoniobacteraceae bacterium]|nr:hypothetical protein [Chthoniobacteraceae bacterium]